MLTRERLWQRISGAQYWSLSWALAAACSLPWLIPERWDGVLRGAWIGAGALLVLSSLPLLRSRRWAPVPLTLGLLALTLLGLARHARLERALPLGFQDMEGRICAPWSQQGQRRLGRIALEAPPCLKGSEVPLSLPLEGETAPEPGTPVRLRAELMAVDPAPAFIGERPLWRARDGAARRIHLRSAQLLEALGPPRPSLLLRLQVFAWRRFQALPLPAGTGRDLWGALSLGIPPAQDETFSAFAESGTIHTLVVSGLQVTLVMVALEALWRRTLKRGSGLASALAGLLYCAVVGFSAPVWRGLFMGLAWCLGRGSGWKLPPVLTLHGALLLWLLFHPAAGCEPGFLLAWLALVGLLWIAEPLAGLISPLLGDLALPMARCAAPWLTTLPLLALLHGGAPLWGVAANLLLLPLVALLTPVCLLLTLLPLQGPVHLVGLVLTWTGERGVPFFARIVPLGTAILTPWIALILGWLWLAQRQGRLQRTRALSVALVALSFGLLLSHGTGRAPGTLSLEAVDIGQGDALLLRQPGGAATLVDTGGSPWAARRIARVLSRRGVREPVHLLVTHPHGDHAGGWATLVRLWPLASVSLPDTALPVEAWTPVASEAMLHSATRLRRGDGWCRGEAELSVRWPPKPFDLTDANMIALVTRVRWRDRELWLMGDVLRIQERDLLDLGDPGPGSPRRVLKPGHHGSRSASDPAWIHALQPELAVLTAGRRSNFEFPHPETLATLKGSGCQGIWVVGEQYGVRIEATSGGWRVTPGLEQSIEQPTGNR